MSPHPDAAATRTTGFAEGGVRHVLRLEGLAVLALSAIALWQLGASWLLVLVLFFAPDLAFAAYLAGPRAGAALYNLAHSYAAAAILGATAWLAGSPTALILALIWTAHIGFDRMLGYGLKYASGFGHTHLGPIGRGR